LKNDLEESRNHLTKFDNGKLDEILSNQKFASDKIGMGFDKFATSSSKSNYSPTKDFLSRQQMRMKLLLK
jgi:hypothetical protein